ncbi:polysaccharide pyruvyl transferase family protein [Vibrio diabolicus]|uniref:polysaccharide pyruvyl transferase family protein n=1 Tax=Vibrio diabolicus TaxID=50719 RepID=UPI0037537190
MKIAIFSLPLTWNYGGILQQYALQKYLERQGHEVHIITVRKDRKSTARNMLVSVKWAFVSFLAKISLFGFTKLIDVERFKSSHLNNVSKLFFSREDVEKFLNSNDFDLLVVGSDQIWNRSATQSLDVSFLNYKVEAKKVSYAASFAKSDIDYTSEELEFARACLKKFEGISVREASGIDILNEYFDSEGEHLLDPTLLLESVDYPVANNVETKQEYVFSYILDKTAGKNDFKRKICKRLGLPEEDFVESKGYRGVETWLTDIKNSSFVVTDSFHGMCFSILYRKNFIVVGNRERGLDRFHSLLGLLNLGERLIYPEDLPSVDLDELVSNIDWESVYMRLMEERSKSKDYFNKI